MGYMHSVCSDSFPFSLPENVPLLLVKTLYMLCTHAIEHVCPFVLRSLTFDPTMNNITTSTCGDLDLW